MGRKKERYWTEEEDRKLVDYINEHGPGKWEKLSRDAGLLNRGGESCRQRWMNQLRPDIKRGKFSREEVEIIIRGQADLGNKWSAIATCLPGRTDNEIKNYWNTHLKRKWIPPLERNLQGSSSGAAAGTQAQPAVVLHAPVDDVGNPDRGHILEPRWRPSLPDSAAVAGLHSAPTADLHHPQPITTRSSLDGTLDSIIYGAVDPGSSGLSSLTTCNVSTRRTDRSLRSNFGDYSRAGLSLAPVAADVAHRREECLRGFGPIFANAPSNIDGRPVVRNPGLGPIPERHRRPSLLDLATVADQSATTCDLRLPQPIITGSCLDGTLDSVVYGAINSGPSGGLHHMSCSSIRTPSMAPSTPCLDLATQKQLTCMAAQPHDVVDTGDVVNNVFNCAFDECGTFNPLSGCAWGDLSGEDTNSNRRVNLILGQTAPKQMSRAYHDQEGVITAPSIFPCALVVSPDPQNTTSRDSNILVGQLAGGNPVVVGEGGLVSSDSFRKLSTDPRDRTCQILESVEFFSESQRMWALEQLLNAPEELNSHRFSEEQIQSAMHILSQEVGIPDV